MILSWIGFFVVPFVFQRKPCAVLAISYAEPKDGVDWDSFGFGLNGVETDAMWMNRVEVEDGCGEYSESCDECLVPLGDLQLHPSCTHLNYGQGIFEGLKAFRQANGSIVVFRPDKNAARMAGGASRFLIPPVPSKTFIHAVDAVVRANAGWVPPFGKGALYLRPLLFGSGRGLGVGPSKECTFCIYASPVGNYFKGGLASINLQAAKGFSRAAPGGTGWVKAAGNYAPAFKIQKEARERGFDEVLVLDALRGEAVEEAGASNFFAVFPNKTIVTPTLSTETLLAGVTRLSIVELAAKECGYNVVEGFLTVGDLETAIEAFCCGTGASITPVGSISVSGESSTESKTITFGDGKTPGTLTQHLYNMLLDIQMGTNETLGRSYSHWIHEVVPQSDAIGK